MQFFTPPMHHGTHRGQSCESFCCRLPGFGPGLSCIQPLPPASTSPSTWFLEYFSAGWHSASFLPEPLKKSDPGRNFWPVEKLHDSRHPTRVLFLRSPCGGISRMAIGLVRRRTILSANASPYCSGVVRPTTRLLPLGGSKPGRHGRQMLAFGSGPFYR